MAALASHALADRFGYEIEWTAVGICLTAIIAVWKLREDSRQKVLDRELQTKRDILFEGIKSMAKAQQAFSSLSNVNIKLEDLIQSFQEAMSGMTMASSVASIHTAAKGKEFGDKLGPLFMEAMRMRAALDHLENGPEHPHYFNRQMELGVFVISNILEVGKAMLRAVAAVRSDVGIAKETQEEFLAAVYPNEELVKNTIDKISSPDPRGSA